MVYELLIVQKNERAIIDVVEYSCYFFPKGDRGFCNFSITAPCAGVPTKSGRSAPGFHFVVEFLTIKEHKEDTSR